ncbi:MAG TPA: DUF2336 domain-containing protein [Allosphingosinicella sp.]
MSDDRLTTAENGDDARLLDAAVRERLAVAAADLRLKPSLRLTEWQRATVSALAAKVVRTVEDDLRISLADAPHARANEALHAALTSAHVAIAAPILERSGAHAEPPLVAALIRRTEEHRLARSRGNSEAGLLLELIRDEDEQVSEQAMAILIAHSRRFDGFGEPVAARTELPAELEHRLAWRVAAALRAYMIDRHGVPAADADAMLVSAAERLLADYDEGDGLEARCMRLARRLDQLGRVDDDLTERSLTEGSLPLFLAFISVRASLGRDAAWEIVSDPRGRGAPLLLKASDLGREQAGSILLGLASSEDLVASQLDLFDVTSAAEARAALRLWQVDPFYREALAEIAA